jgi:glycerol uptake facilitator-like aquaporin
MREASWTTVGANGLDSGFESSASIAAFVCATASFAFAASSFANANPAVTANSNAETRAFVDRISSAP